MAKLPNKPRSGQKTIAALYRSICQIIDYLPSLTVKGDGKNIKVTNSDSGKIISVKNNNLSNWKYQGDYQKYIFGRGVKSEYDQEICSGLDGIPKELLPQFVTLNLSGDGTYISASIPSSITDPVIISYIGPAPSGGGGSGGIVYTAGSGISISGTTIQTTFLPGCDIWFWDHSNDGASPGNYITIENGLSAGFGIKFKDNNPEGDYHMHYIGVDLVGGDYISIVTGTTAGGTPVNYPTIRCNLSATGYIGLSTVYLNQYDTGAVITTNLHGDGTTVTIDNDGTIHSHASGGTGGQTLSAASGINIFASGGVDYIETTFRPGVDIYFWDHSSDTNPQNVITIQNGLSAGNGITFRDNTVEEGTSTYHQHYIDWSVSATHWLDYNSGYAVLSCTLDGDNSTVFIANDGTISANVWQYNSGTGISVDNTNHTITLTADIPSPGVSYSAGSGIAIYTSGGSEYIRTNFEPGCDIWFWDHNNDTNPEDRITVQNGLSAGYGITLRDNTSKPGVATYHQHYMDVDIAGGQWLEYNVSAATMSCTLTGDGSTVFINSNGVISAKTGTILPTPVANKILSSNSSKQLVWAENTGGTPSPTPSGGGMAWPNYFNLGEESDSRVYPLMRYTTLTGGWLRVSCRGGTSRCVGVWVGDNYYGLGQGIMTWSLAIPPASSFYVDVDWNINNLIWFDSSLNLSKATNAEIEYWLTPPYWESDRKAILSCKTLFDYARSNERYCYDYLTGAQGKLKEMITDWTTHERYVPDPDDPDEQHPDGYTPEGLSFYEDRLNEITGCYENCEYPLTAAQNYCNQLDTLNQSLPSACPMYDYQATDIPAKCQQYYDTIGQYVISAQHYYDLASAYWAEHE